MELTLEPVRPIKYKADNGKYLFGKGYIPKWAGKTLEECYGKQRADEIKRKMSEKRKGRKHPHGPGRVTPVVVIHQGKLIARFSSTREAERKTGIYCESISRYLRHGVKPRNGWKWFYEKDIDKWEKELLQ